MKRLLIVLASIMTVATGAWALEPSGTYTYKEKGYSGEMTISRINPAEASWKINILTVESTNAHTCEVDGVINNMISDGQSVEAVFVSTEESPGKFTVKFTKAGAVVDVSENTSFCGMNGYFGGMWVKDGSKRKTRKIKK